MREQQSKKLRNIPLYCASGRATSLAQCIKEEMNISCPYPSTTADRHQRSHIISAPPPKRHSFASCPLPSSFRFPGSKSQKKEAPKSPARIENPYDMFLVNRHRLVVIQYCIQEGEVIYWIFSPAALRLDEVLPAVKYLANTGCRKLRKITWAPLV